MGALNRLLTALLVLNVVLASVAQASVDVSGRLCTHASTTVGIANGTVSGELDLGQILRNAAISAGTSYLQNAVNLKAAGDVTGAASAEASGIAANEAANAFGNRTFNLLSTAWDPSLTTSVFGSNLTAANVLEGAFDASIGATIQTAAYGGRFGDAFKGSFINSVVALGLADTQTGIGDVFAREGSGGEGSLGHVLLHGLAGCVAAEAQGADCAAGAAGGIAGAIYSGMQKAPERGSYASDAAYQAAFTSWKTDVLAQGELVSLTAAYMFSGGKAENVGAANLVSNSAIANNYLTHAQFDALESELTACGTNAECNRQVVSRYTEISAEQQHELAMCGNDIACMAPHLQAIAQASNHPLRAAMLASRGVRSTALQEFEYQVEVAYLGHTESMFDTGLFEGIYTPNYSRYFEYPDWAASNCSGLAASACMAGFQQQLKSDLYLQGMGSGAQAFAISAGVGSIAVAPSAALALRQCAANPVCFSNLNLDLTVALGELTGATAGQMAFTVRVGGAIAGKLVLTHGDQIVSVIDDLGRVLRPVSQTPDDLGRFLVTTTDGVTGYLDDGRFVAANLGPRLTIRDHYVHHKAMTDDLKAQLQSQGYRVSDKEILFGSSCGTGRCRPDIVYETPDGKIGIIEVKTGNAELTIRQSEIYPQIKDGDAIPRGKVADDFGLEPGVPLKDQGYPNGIPIEIRTFPGASQ